MAVLPDLKITLPDVDPNKKAQERISKICNLFPNNYELNKMLKQNYEQLLISS